ncbi:hypothetical protein V8G69_10915 [Gaetbulibacter sp. M235]|uniref:hypothetical protein n=1 Tax=Gaetbulibacter sp. M235 TaxID=3126510 RepID=UPI00374EF92E
MKRVIFSLIAFTFFILTIGCSAFQNSGNSNLVIRQAENTPENFLPAKGLSLNDNSCINPMIDPRDGTQLIMVSSNNGMANYKVSPYKYGLRKGELLRVDCKTGIAVGIVKE